MAYHHATGSEPGVLFCAGYGSTMDGNKALHLQTLCETQGWQYTRFDYSGTGLSDGSFDSFGIDDWLEDVIDILDRVCTGPQIVVGSSMGGWIATLLAERLGSRIAGLLGVASAPDFTEEIYWNKLELGAQNRLASGEAIVLLNRYEPDSPRKLSMDFIESGRRCLVLDTPLHWSGPVRLLHGTSDEDVPASLSQRLMQQLNSHDAQLTLVKDADHRFSTDDQLNLLGKQLCELYCLCS